MSSRRTLILLGAIAVGVVAALLLFNYVKGIEDRANNNAKRVDVFVAKGQVKRGTPGETAVKDGSIGSAKIQQEFKPSTAINTTDEITKKVALFDIAPGTVIVQGMFVDPAQTQISFRERLKNPDHVAITISVDQIHGVGGFLVPGDEVNILVLQTSTTGEGQGQPPTNSVTGVLKTVARTLYQKVHILAVGQSTLKAPGEQATSSSSSSGSSSSSSSSQSSDSGVITFNVPPDAALWIASAQSSGTMYLNLVGEDYKPKEIPPLDPKVTLLPGEDPAVLTPYGPGGYKE